MWLTARYGQISAVGTRLWHHHWTEDGRIAQVATLFAIAKSPLARNIDCVTRITRARCHRIEWTIHLFEATELSAILSNMKRLFALEAERVARFTIDWARPWASQKGLN